MKLTFRKNERGDLEADLPVKELISNELFLAALRQLISSKASTNITREEIMAIIEEKAAQIENNLSAKIRNVYFLIFTIVFSLFMVTGFFELLKNIR